MIAHDMRSTHNLGALFRTAECMGVKQLYLTGYTPYPTGRQDERLPHIQQKLSRQIEKTALGTTEQVPWAYLENVLPVVRALRTDGFELVALEQTPRSVLLPSWMPSDKIAILLGREVEGIEPGLLALCDHAVEIPQFGHKESLNVIQAAAMTLYHCRFAPFSISMV